LHFGQWKYIEAMTKPKKQPALLFDMHADPKEARNLLAINPEVAEQGRELLAEIVDGDDVIEWDGGGGGYKHAPAFDPRAGKYHLELKAITGVTGEHYCYIYKDLPAQAGQTWEASIYAKLTERPGRGRATAQFKITFLDAKGKKLRTHESKSLTAMSDEYQPLGIRATAPKGATLVRMTPVVNLKDETGTVAAYFDDARLASGETVFESGFETGAVR
jgi:hypothetical protein